MACDVVGLVGLPIAGFYSHRGCVLTDSEYLSPKQIALQAELANLQAQLKEEGTTDAAPSQGVKGLKKLAQERNTEIQKLSISLKEQEIADASADNRCINHNKWAMCPLVNLAMGVHKIYEAIFTDGSQYGVPPDRADGFRIWMFVMGVLELTWIGGIAAHFIAEAYFYFNPSELGETAYEVVQ